MSAGSHTLGGINTVSEVGWPAGRLLTEVAFLQEERSSRVQITALPAGEPAERQVEQLGWQASAGCLWHAWVLLMLLLLLLLFWVLEENKMPSFFSLRI